MTLGKVERFWSTIWQEFLCRAQFESFEVAQERIKLWIRYYIRCFVMILVCECVHSFPLSRVD